MRLFGRFTISCERCFPALKLIKTMNFHVCLALRRKLNQTSLGDSFIIWYLHTGTHTFLASGNKITSMHIWQLGFSQGSEEATFPNNPKRMLSNGKRSGTSTLNVFLSYLQGGPILSAARDRLGFRMPCGLCLVLTAGSGRTNAMSWFALPACGGSWAGAQGHEAS